jgi:hypothetical protein
VVPVLGDEGLGAHLALQGHHRGCANGLARGGGSGALEDGFGLFEMVELWFVDWLEPR